MAATTSILLGGIAINEFIADPNSVSNNFDTDGNGTASATDEFVEVVNTSGAAIDISGLELWDAGAKNWFSFPPGTILGAGNVAVVVVGVQAGGSLPTVSGGNLAFDAGRGSGVLNNTGDNIVAYDPGADQYIQLTYNGDATDDPTTYTGFSATATQVGVTEDFGNDIDGVSLVRSPDGDTNTQTHNAVAGLGGTLASPGASGDNTAPLFAALDAAPAYTEGDAALVIDADATISDAQYDAYAGGSGDYNTATLTIERAGGANADDVFEGSGTLTALTEGGAITVAGTDIGTVTTNSGGTLLITFNHNATTALVNSALDQIAYSNPAQPLPVGISETFDLDITINDGALSQTTSLTVTHTGIDSDDLFSGTAGVADTINAGIGNDTVFGLSRDDILNGEDGNDIINGGHGSDTITGGAGNDMLYGAFGNDVIDGGEGDDIIKGNDHRDTLTGGKGADTLYGGADDDTLSGGTGSDRLYGGTGNDILNGNRGNDRLRGGDGDDQLFGLLNRDHLEGGAGNDLLDGGEARDWLFGGAGADTFVFAATYGTDSIEDWEDGTDVIDLTSFGFTDFNTDVLANAVQNGADLVVTFGADILTINNLLLADFDSSDVLLSL